MSASIPMANSQLIKYYYIVVIRRTLDFKVILPL